MKPSLHIETEKKASAPIGTTRPDSAQPSHPVVIYTPQAEDITRLSSFLASHYGKANVINNDSVPLSLTSLAADTIVFTSVVPEDTPYVHLKDALKEAGVVSLSKDCEVVFLSSETHRIAIEPHPHAQLLRRLPEVCCPTCSGSGLRVQVSVDQSPDQPKTGE